MIVGKEQLSLEQMKEIQIGILDYFDDVCKNNNIKWWLEFGTLIGAVRHKGFIPWDDDIDVAMLRKDYESLKTVFNKCSQIDNNGRYRLLDPENDKEYKYSFGKVVDTRTVLFEGNRELIQSGVYIDVFVYDAAPDNNKEYKRMLERRNQLGKLRSIKLFEFDKDNVSIRALIAVVRKYILTPLSMRTILMLMQKNAKKYMGVKTGKIADFLWPYDNFSFYLKDDFFDNLIEIEFEGRLFPAPENYDDWLRMIYGDYMVLPPVEQRVQHRVKAYYIK